MKKIGILGSTGSIGTQTLEVVREKEDLKVIALAAGSNVEELERQAREFRPKLAVLYNEEGAALLKEKLKDTGIKVAAGMEGLLEAATLTETDIFVTAIVGMIGIRPTIAAIEMGKQIALANKETLVTAGHIIMPLAKEKKVDILPVDSEHSAIFQCMGQNGREEVEKLLLTASGGPFFGKKRKDLMDITVEEALKHPNWSMGKKITIDSSTLVNKGLEVIEAKWLFSVDLEQIQVVVHPQSVIHSMVQYQDGSVIAQMGLPDMKLPIQYALYYPERKYLRGDRLNFNQCLQLTFDKPDLDTFFGLKLAIEAACKGGSAPTVFNAANEKAVQLFLDRKIQFLQIPEIIQWALESHKLIDNPSVSQILEIERETYELIKSRW